MRGSDRHDFTLPDETKCTLHTDLIPPHTPRWVRLFVDKVPALQKLLNSNASALLFVQRGDRLYALTFGYGRSLLEPGSWEEDFGLRVTLNSVDIKKIRSVDRATLDSIGQHSRIQASREATMGEFGLDLEQDLLQAVTGIPTDVTLGKQLTGKDALNVKLPITLNKLPELLDRYTAQAASQAYKEVFPWLDQIHELKNPATIAELDTIMVERIKAEDFTKGLWLSIPEIIDWSEVDGFKYRDAQSAPSHIDVHISTFLEEIGGAKATSLEMLKKRRKVHAVSQLTGEVIESWTVYRCLYCEIEQGNETYLLNNGKWYRVGTDFRQRINEQFTKVPRCELHLPQYDDKSETEYNARIVKQFPSQFELLDKKLIKCSGQYDKIEFCDLLGKDKKIIHVKRYAGGSAPLSHMFAQAVVSGSLLRRDSDFRKQVINLLSEPFQNLIHEPETDEYEIVLAIVSKSKHDLTIPFFSRVNLNNAWVRLQELGYRVSLAKIQA
jgi:uncharacterized protein (TIGR04141 family)